MVDDSTTEPDESATEDEVCKPCRSPYCECPVGQCNNSPEYYDARGTYPEGWFRKS